VLVEGLELREDGGLILAYLARQGALLIIGPGTGADTQGEGQPLWLATVPSGAVRRLGNLKVWSAAFSPDEERLAVVYGGAWPNNRIGLAKADGSDLRELVKGPAGWIGWAPDGKRLRFSSSPPAGEDGEWIWETSVRGETPQLLWRGTSGRWTPDGRHFVFQRSVRAHFWASSRVDLWAAWDASWRLGPRPSPVRLSFGPMSLTLPGFGPDGHQLFAWGDREYGELLRYDSKTRGLEGYLGGLSGHYTDASPDGQWVAYVSYPEQELWKCRSDGSQRVQLSRPGTLAALPRWSPDGREIVFNGMEPNEDRSSLRRVSAGGGADEVLARPEAGASFWDACWLPGGAQLVFSHHAPDRPGILKLDLRTKQVSSLPGAEKLMYPKCSGQGHLLAWAWQGKEFSVRWQGRPDWKEVDLHRVAFPNWTRDGEAIIGLNLTGPRVERLDLKARQWTTVVDLAQTPLVPSDGVAWMGLAADDSPVVVRDRGTRDLYAFDWEAP
jgi:Tol biopolymer transport system component